MRKPSNVRFPPPPQTPADEAKTCVFSSYPDNKFCFYDHQGGLHEFDDYDTAYATALMILNPETT